jgi:hypothetical protein
VLCLSATAFIVLASFKLRFSFSPVNSSARDRQSSAGSAFARASVNAPVSRPACMGL